MPSFASCSDFETASAEVLNFLHARLGFQLWMVTRAESDDWIVLTSHDQGYNVNAGDVFKWTDSFCSRMVNGLGPRIAPRSNEISVYASAPIGQQVAIGAYAGVPLTRHDGQLFGTLCAIDPAPMPDNILDELPMIEMMSSLLMTILEFELKTQDALRTADREYSNAMCDQLTGLYNRRGWDELMAKEEQRCKRYGQSACVVSIDLDDLKIVNDEQGHAEGDALLCRAAQAIVSATRESDVVARLGGDEFSILAVHCADSEMEGLTHRLLESFELENVSASIGVAQRQSSGSLTETLAKADEKMYECKNHRKAARAKHVNPGLRPFPQAKSLDSRIDEISRILGRSPTSLPSS
jgi:diguanylate cyclase